VVSRVNGGIVKPFEKAKSFAPFSRTVATENAEIAFHFLIYTFTFSVSLRVEGSRQCRGNGKSRAKGLKDVGNELGSAIRDDFVRKSILRKDMIEEKGAKLFGRTGLVTRNEAYRFGESLIDHGEDSIKSITEREIGDEVHRNVLEWARGGLVGQETGASGVSNDFVLLAGMTTIDVGVDKFSHGRPPIVTSDTSKSAKASWMAGQVMVIIANLVKKIITIWNDKFVAVEQEIIVGGPVVQSFG
jgi:hypothetical protein